MPTDSSLALPSRVRADFDRLARSISAAAPARFRDVSPRTQTTCSVSISRRRCCVPHASLHHLPIAATLARVRDALRPGRLLLILDLVRDASLRDFAASVLAVPTNLALHLVKTGARREPPAVRAAWMLHGRSVHYLSLGEVRAACDATGLAGAHLQRHLLWRYSLLWQKPG